VGSASRGSGLGLPPDGPGSLASPGVRLGAFVVDAIVANLLAGVPALFGSPVGPGDRGLVVYLAFLLQEFVLVSVAGASIGKRMFGIRVIRVDGTRLPWYWVLARTALLAALVPAVVWDRDGRGLHDKAAGALTVRVGHEASAPVEPPRPAARDREPARTAATRPARPASRKRRKKR
jgi:uncharacterized RDD family membrane protein YckC